MHTLHRSIIYIRACVYIYIYIHVCLILRYKVTESVKNINRRAGLSKCVCVCTCIYMYVCIYARIQTRINTNLQESLRLTRKWDPYASFQQTWGHMETHLQCKTTHGLVRHSHWNCAGDCGQRRCLQPYQAMQGCQVLHRPRRPARVHGGALRLMLNSSEDSHGDSDCFAEWRSYCRNSSWNSMRNMPHMPVGMALFEERVSLFYAACWFW